VQQLTKFLIKLKSVPQANLLKSQMKAMQIKLINRSLNLLSRLGLMSKQKQSNMKKKKKMKFN